MNTSQELHVTTEHHKATENVLGLGRCHVPPERRTGKNSRHFFFQNKYNRILLQNNLFGDFLETKPVAPTNRMTRRMIHIVRRCWHF